jgi:hypothetical protein
MRKRMLIGVATGLVLSISVASVARADITWNSQSLVVTPSSPAQDKKKPGPLNSFFTDVITDYTQSGPPSGPDRWATNTKVYFPKDFVFTTAGLPQCEPTPAFTSGTTANALATCGSARVSTAGSANLKSELGDTPAVVTAFNGTPDPVSGAPRILLHSATDLANRTLIGSLVNSDDPAYGKMLDVPVDLGPFQGTAVITDFRVTIGKVKIPTKKAASSAKKKGKKKKKKKAPKYYIMAKCSSKNWGFKAVTTYNTGPNSVATDPTNACKQKKKKKKKKKK